MGREDRAASGLVQVTAEGCADPPSTSPGRSPPASSQDTKPAAQVLPRSRALTVPVHEGWVPGQAQPLPQPRASSSVWPCSPFRAQWVTLRRGGLGPGVSRTALRSRATEPRRVPGFGVCEEATVPVFSPLRSRGSRGTGSRAGTAQRGAVCLPAPGVSPCWHRGAGGAGGGLAVPPARRSVSAFPGSPLLPATVPLFEVAEASLCSENGGDGGCSCPRRGRWKGVGGGVRHGRSSSRGGGVGSTPALVWGEGGAGPGGSSVPLALADPLCGIQPAPGLTGIARHEACGPAGSRTPYRSLEASDRKMVLCDIQ